MEGKSTDDAKKVISTQLWPSLKLNWCIWPVAQMINFTFVPVQHRVGYVSVLLVFWNSILSYIHHKDLPRHDK